MRLRSSTRMTALPLVEGLASTTASASASAEAAAEAGWRHEIVLRRVGGALDAGHHLVPRLELARDDLGEGAVRDPGADLHRFHLPVGEEHVNRLPASVGLAAAHAAKALARHPAARLEARAPRRHARGVTRSHALAPVAAPAAAGLR